MASPDGLSLMLCEGARARRVVLPVVNRLPVVRVSLSMMGCSNGDLVVGFMAALCFE